MNKSDRSGSLTDSYFLLASLQKLSLSSASKQQTLPHTCHLENGHMLRTNYFKDMHSDTPWGRHQALWSPG